MARNNTQRIGSNRRNNYDIPSNWVDPDIKSLQQTIVDYYKQKIDEQFNEENKLKSEANKKIANYEYQQAVKKWKKDNKGKAFDSKARAEINKAATKSAADKIKAKNEASELSYSDIKQLLKDASSSKEAERASNLLSAKLSNFGEDFKAGINKLGDALNGAFTAVDSQLDVYKQYYTSVTSRLAGSGSTFDTAVNKLISSSAFNSYFNNKDYIANLNSLVQKGISNNIEQRAWLQTVANQIVTTFDATDGTLLRLIRLQQADSTATKMALEGSLNKYLNAQYQTSEYLNSVYDIVSGNLVEATAWMSGTSGANFESTVQKWLGSLYSVGMSDSTVGNIATALGQLGSGDVTGISEQMQNLLIMAANSQNMSYGELLKNGLNSSNVNTLLYGLTSYLQQIGNTDNNVVRSQLSKVFGISVSDLRAAKWLNTGSVLQSNVGTDLGSILSSGAGYYNLYTKVENVLDNMMFDIASNIAGSDIYSGAWLAGRYANSIGKLFGDTNSITGWITNTKGNVIASALETISNGVKTTVLAGSAISTIIDKIGAVSNGSWGIGSSGLGSIASMFGINTSGGSTVISGKGTSYSDNFGSGVNNVQDVKTNSSKGSEINAQDTQITETKLETIEQTATNIYELLQNVVSGVNSFHITTETTSTSNVGTLSGPYMA